MLYIKFLPSLGNGHQNQPLARLSSTQHNTLWCNKKSKKHPLGVQLVEICNLTSLPLNSALSGTHFFQAISKVNCAFRLPRTRIYKNKSVSVNSLLYFDFDDTM